MARLRMMTGSVMIKRFLVWKFLFLRGNMFPICDEYTGIITDCRLEILAVTDIVDCFTPLSYADVMCMLSAV